MSNKTIATVYLQNLQNQYHGIGFSQQKETSGYRSVSREEYAQQALRLSSYLRGQGIGRGDKLLLIAENSPEWGIIAMAAFNLGAILVPVASMSTANELIAVIERAQPKFCFISTTTTAFRTIERAKLPSYFALTIQSLDPLGEITANQEPDSLNPNGGDATDVALLIYTSGTTGTPKGVPLTHENVLTNVEDITDIIEVRSTDVVVSVLPLSHMLEFTGGFLLAISRGVKIIYVRSLRAEDILKAMKDHGCTILLAVPLLFEIIARNMQQKIEILPKPMRSVFGYGRSVIKKKPKLGRALLSPLHAAFGGKIRFFVAGGAKLQPWVYEFFESIGIKILQGYGLTETAPVLAVSGLSTAGPNHVGRAVKSVSVAVFSEDGQELGRGVEGEIWAKGTSVFAGYENQEHNSGNFEGDWFRTGDLGVIDKDGFIEITGRKKDIIVTPGGKNVYPEEIEVVLSQTGKFIENTVLAMQDDSGHEKVCVVVRPDRLQFSFSNEADFKSEVRKSVASALADLSDYKQPQQIEIYESDFPKTHTRKVKRHELRKLVQEAKAKEGGSEHTQPTGDSLDSLNKLEKTVGEAISGITRKPFDSLSKKDSLTADLGLDSLTTVEVIGIFEKTFVTQVEGIELGTIETLGQLLSELEKIAKDPSRKRLSGDPWFSNFPPMEGAKFWWAYPRYFANLVLRGFMRLYCSLRTENSDKIPVDGPLIFTPNHSSHFDVLSIEASVGFNRIRKLFAVAAKDYFFNREWKSLFVRLLLNAIPFDRKKRVEEGMHKCKEIIDQGGSLIIFPEGTRSPDGSLSEFKPGVGQLLTHSKKVRAVPVYIHGAHKLFPKGSSFPRPGNLKVVYGEPISFADLEPTPESYSIIAKRLQAEVEKLRQKTISNS